MAWDLMKPINFMAWMLYLSFVIGLFGAMISDSIMGILIFGVSTSLGTYVLQTIEDNK